MIATMRFSNPKAKNFPYYKKVPMKNGWLIIIVIRHINSWAMEFIFAVDSLLTEQQADELIEKLKEGNKNATS